MKKLSRYLNLKIFFILSVVLLSVLCGCSDTPNMVIREDVTFRAEPAKVVISSAGNVDLGIITEDPQNEILVVTNDSIVYSCIAESQKNVNSCDFYRYVIETQEHIKLGTVYNCSYGLGHCFVNNKIYIPRLCQLTTSEEVSNWILELDLNTNTMSVVSKGKEHETIYNYNMQGFGKYLILLQTQDELQRLVAYDTDTRELIALMTYEYNSIEGKGEQIRAFDVGQNSISILIKEIDDSASEKYRIDIYDDEIRLIDTMDVTMMANWSKGVKDFEYENGYLIGSNINNEGFVGKINGNEVNTIAEFEETSLFLLPEITECMRYKMWLDRETNEIFRFDMQNGIIEKAKLNIKGIEDCSVSILRYSEESMVIKLTSNKEQIFHYILMEEIEFISI